VYDHSDGTFGPPELRRRWDVSVFLDPDPELRIAWKIGRDMSKRGYTRDEVLKQLEHRRHDSETYVMPQREKADMVISFFPPADYAKVQDNAKLNVRITLRHPIPLPDLEEALAVAERRNGNASVKLERGREGTDVLEIKGCITDAATHAIEDRIWSHMPSARHLRSDRLGVFNDGTEVRHSNSLAVTQLVLTYYLVKASALVLKQERLRAEAEAVTENAR
jgi:phosphoribulokinase